MKIDWLVSQKIRLNNKWLNLAFRISLYLILAAIMLNISWNAWPDLVKDFGIELYIPWRITEGDVLYRDIYYYQYGPLSFYWNALWFYLLGTSIYTLITVNLILLIFLIYLLEDWITALSDHLTATVAVLFFLTAFAFSRYVGIGNYNYLAPYAHGATHGLIISLAMLACLRHWINTKKLGWLLTAGLLLGLTTLTKIEVAFSSIAAVGSFFAAILFIHKDSRIDILKKIGMLLVASAIPPVVTIFLFSIAIPPNEAVSGIFSQWLALWDGRIAETSQSLYYRHSTGLDNIAGNLLKLGKESWIYLNFILVAMFLALILHNIKRWRLLMYLTILVSSSVFYYFTISRQAWFDLARPLPLMMAIGFILSIWFMVKNLDVAINSKYPLYLASFALAGTLLLKIALNARIYNYGFVLSMPATLLIIVILVSWLPRYLNRYEAGNIFRIMALSLLLVASIIYINSSYRQYATTKFDCCPTTKASDTIKTNALQGPVIAKALEELNKRLKPNQTFIVVPEGVILNYILRHRNPTPYIHFVPTMLINNKEEDIIDSFAKEPADFVVFVHIDTSEFGMRFFGKDYGNNLYDWIQKNYRVVWQEGGIPLQAGTNFGVSISEHIIK